MRKRFANSAAPDAEIKRLVKRNLYTKSLKSRLVHTSNVWIGDENIIAKYSISFEPNPRPNLFC